MVRLSSLTLLHASSEDVQKKIKIGYAKVFQQGLAGLLPAVEAAALAQRADGIREGMVHLIFRGTFGLLQPDTQHGALEFVWHSTPILTKPSHIVEEHLVPSVLSCNSSESHPPKP